MGLMDRDYYREKTKPSRKKNILEKIKENPWAVVAVVIALLFLISVLL